MGKKQVLFLSNQSRSRGTNGIELTADNADKTDFAVEAAVLSPQMGLWSAREDTRP
jgi:hypothetical protein